MIRTREKEVNASRETSRIAQNYLTELESALSEVPASVRSDLLADIEAELEGLDDDRAAACITRLGDPRKIAADATDVDGPGTSRSRVYPVITVSVLIFGGYLIPVIGWIAGLVLIGRGSGWTAAVRRRAMLVSVAGVIGSLLVLGLLHAFGNSSSLTIPGIVVVALLPFVVNVVIGRYLNREWSSPLADQ